MRNIPVNKYVGFCGAPPDTPSDTYVGAASEVQLLRWIWKVRKWDFHIDISLDPYTLTYDQTLQDGQTSTYDTTNGFRGFQKYDNERQKICPRILNHTASLFPASGTFAQLWVGTYGFVDPDLDVWAWFLDLEGAILFDPGPGLASFSTGSADFPLTSVDFKFDGQSVPLYGEGGASMTGTITMTPTITEGFWPYERSNGGTPLLDKDTGIPLVSVNSPEFYFVG